MDPDKLAFLFDEIPEGFDPDDEDDRALLLSEQLGLDDDRDAAAVRFRLAIQTVIANQIALGQPPEVWHAAQRMMAEGVDRARALGNLVLAFLGPLHTTVTEQSEFDEERYRHRLSRLPLPTPDEVDDALIAIACERQPIDADELLAAAAGRFATNPTTSCSTPSPTRPSMSSSKVESSTSPAPMPSSMCPRCSPMSCSPTRSARPKSPPTPSPSPSTSRPSPTPSGPSWSPPMASD